MTDDILKTLNVTNENAALLTANLLDVMQEIKQGKGTVSYLIYDTTLRKELSQAVFNL
jgi:phospholipid/cholesterol/gamma-HCH transport system substrate-binding protein